MDESESCWCPCWWLSGREPRTNNIFCSARLEKEEPRSDGGRWHHHKIHDGPPHVSIQEPSPHVVLSLGRMCPNRIPDVVHLDCCQPRDSQLTTLPRFLSARAKATVVSLCRRFFVVPCTPGIVYSTHAVDDPCRTRTMKTLSVVLFSLTHTCAYVVPVFVAVKPCTAVAACCAWKSSFLCLTSSSSFHILLTFLSSLLLKDGSSSCCLSWGFVSIYLGRLPKRTRWGEISLHTLELPFKPITHVGSMEIIAYLVIFFFFFRYKHKPDKEWAQLIDSTQKSSPFTCCPLPSTCLW